MLFKREQIKENIKGKLKRHFGKTLENASSEQVYQSVALTVRDMILDQSLEAEAVVAEKQMKRLYYISAEFLMGRALVNSMINLGVYEDYRHVLGEIGHPIERLEEEENDAGLGNGGLGRLAACFLDSLSTRDLPAMGCGIRYEYGLFRQRIVDGQQTETPDDWMENGDVWEIERPEEQVEVRFGGTIEENWTENGLNVIHKNYQSVIAVPYDMPVIGYKSHTPATLRLWSARCPTDFDLNSFNKGDYMCALQQRELSEVITKVLYPEDDHIPGRMLRLKQFYFLASAVMQNMVKNHKAKYGDVRSLPDKATIQINDTHPTFAIPELLRILMDEEHLGWDEAFDITGRLFHYTNHTVMPEALERWPEQLIKTLFPRIHGIIRAIHDKFSEKLWKVYAGDWDKISRLSVIAYDEVRMANLCIAVCGTVNGVSRLHGNILKTTVFRDFYTIFPEKFTYVTNGITQRRWLAKANPGLTELIADHIGGGFLTDYRELAKLERHIDDPRFLRDFAAVKRANKERLAEYVYNAQKVEINPDTVFDVQAKRLHEYKRQLLKAIHILHLYDRIVTDPGFRLKTPVTFLFAAKASPGYKRAKDIIWLINAIGKLVNENPAARDQIRVVFLENYDVSLAEKLIPAAEISEQISTAGREASGTGNMKFMLNGAVTLGTMDGANVEIYENVGKENIFIFGAAAQEIARMEAENTYSPKALLEGNKDLQQAVRFLTDGSLSAKFQDIFQSLTLGDYDRADKYFVLYDFNAYRDAFYTAAAAYAETDSWNRMAAMNTARAGFFSSDRAIDEYNGKIWHLEAL